MTSQEIIRLLDLKRHPEGGYYRETYRSFDAIPGTSQVYSTAIYYLLVPGSVSKMHRLKADEMFHFYLGDPVTWVLLEPSKNVRKVVLGCELEEGQRPQMLVPAGTWFGGSLNKGGNFALMGTTVAPGFEFEDFVLGKPEELLRDFPGAEKEIMELT
jgi:uncharacterized protein